MNKLNNNLSLWTIFPIMLFLVLAVCIYLIHIPLLVEGIKDFKSYQNDRMVRKSSQQFPSQLKTLKHEMHLLDSTISFRSSQNHNEQKSIIEALYTYADSSGLKTDKVEIGASVSVHNQNEIPVSIQAAGVYESIGRFIERIENARQAVRIRQIVINQTESTNLSLSLDFVIIE